MIYVKFDRKSEAGSLLVKTLVASGLPAKKVPIVPDSLRTTDLVINWGTSWHGEGLNGAGKLRPGDKLKELKLLHQAGVSCIQHNTHRPSTGVWYARLDYHENGSDLTRNLQEGDYYTKHEPTIHEYRIYVFKDQTFATALKEPITGFVNPHPVFRTVPHGWDYTYRLAKVNRLESRHKARLEAIKAIAAVGYDFGGVDVGVRPDGSPVVFELNSCPGLDSYSVERFVTVLTEWLEGGRRG